MLPIANPTLFNAHALPIDNLEPHAQVGNHLRVNTHPSLGLPVAPFVVYRAVVDSVKHLNTRRDVVFIDKNGRQLFAPFRVTPDNPVTARLILGTGEVCIWAQVDALSDDELDGRNRGGGRAFDSRVVIDTVAARRSNLVRLRGALVSPGIDARRLIRRPDLTLRGNILAGAAGRLHCEAYVESALGPASIGTRSTHRYAFSAPGIVEIAIRGSGQVGDVRWVEGRDPQHVNYQPFAIMNLPHRGGARYIALDNALPLAVERVETQAPKRRPLQETQNAPAPTAAPIANVPFERARVESLVPTLQGDLERLINDVSESPFDQTILETLVDENGNSVGTSSMKRLHRVMQVQGDPGTASFLGYKMRDKDFVETEERIVLYRVDGFFRDFPPSGGVGQQSVSQLLFDALLAAVPPNLRDWKRTEMFRLFVSAVGNIPGVRVAGNALAQLESHDDYFGLGAYAIADRGAPLDAIQPPNIVAATHKGWLPEVPPAAKREVSVDVTDVRVAGLLAAGRRTPASGASGNYAALNKKNPDGFHLPLILSLNVDELTGDPISAPGTGFVADRTAGAAAIRYFVAQQDRFGRWSNWAQRNASAGPRPRPPRPEFQAFYTQPSVINAVLMGGDILVKVMVPDAASLAPGSRLLDRLRLFLKDERFGTTTQIEQAESTKETFPGDATTFYLRIPHTGPQLDPTEQRKMRVTARWIDVGNVQSNVSEAQILTLSDPRPPPQPIVPAELQYSARPDVTGLSWVEHSWTRDPSQAQYGVYYSDENRLRSYLESDGQTVVLGALESAGDAADRAMVYRNNVSLFPDHLFERLRDVIVDRNSGDKAFRHAVSGSLRVLNIYKVAAESASGAKPILSELDLIVYGVPNSDPPPRPVLTVAPVSPEVDENDYVARITITLIAGTTLGETWRLRRSGVESSNLARMPIVATGPIGALDSDNGEQRAEYRDDGPVEIAASATLKPWVQYSWVAEIQGVPESGSVAAGKPVPGRWSQASDPVSLILIPAAEPLPMVVDSVAGTAVADGLTDVVLTLSHPDALTGGSVGAYRVRVSRRPKAGAPLVSVREVEVSGDGPFVVSGVLDSDLSETVPVSAEYVLELIDPVGRLSPAVGANVT